MVHKLLSKKIKPEEQKELLDRSPRSEKKVLNVHLGTPSRLLKLVELQALNLLKRDKFKLLIIDMSKNVKQ